MLRLSPDEWLAHCGAIVQHSDDAIISIRSDGIILSWNPAAEQIYGYSAEEIIGQPMHVLTVPDRGNEPPALLERVRRGERVQHYETIRRRKDGKHIHVSLTLSPIRDGQGQIIGASSIGRDITEQRRTETKFRGLLESAPDALVLVNQRGEIVLANLHAEQMFGYPRQQLLGQPVELLVPKAYRAAHVAHRQEYTAQPLNRSMGAGLDLFACRRDGSEFPVEISLSPLLLEEETLVIASIRDVSARKRAEAELRASEERFRQLAENIDEVFWITSGDGKRVHYVSPAYERIWGRPSRDLIDQPGERLAGIHPDDQERVDQALARTPHGQFDEVFRVLRPDGSLRWVHSRGFPVFNQAGEPYRIAGIADDITERKRFEEMLREKNEELERASQAKDRFLATMSHELRTPLNAIIGFTGTMLMRLPGPLTGEQEKQLQIVRASARHLLSLINDLLDLTKIESGRMELLKEPVCCQEVLREVETTLRPAAEQKGLGFAVELPLGDVELQADRRALQQILINLTNNAIKFTDQGHIRLVLDRQDEPPRVRLRVIDTGIGIPPAGQERLFQGFMQLESGRRRQEGTGLGLYLSQQLAGLLGGRISVESTVGQGSTFALVLPES